jgi:hypothetical protein
METLRAAGVSHIFFARIRKILNSLELSRPDTGLASQNLGSKGVIGKIFKNKELAVRTKPRRILAARSPKISWGGFALTPIVCTLQNRG